MIVRLMVGTSDQDVTFKIWLPWPHLRCGWPLPSTHSSKTRRFRLRRERTWCMESPYSSYRTQIIGVIFVSAPTLAATTHWSFTLCRFASSITSHLLFLSQDLLVAYSLAILLCVVILIFVPTLAETIFKPMVRLVLGAIRKYYYYRRAYTSESRSNAIWTKKSRKIVHDCATKFNCRYSSRVTPRCRILGKSMPNNWGFEMGTWATRRASRVVCKSLVFFGTSS